MTADRRVALGKTGEEVACGELVRRGYEILARRYRTRAGELDIVARDGATIVFVEVKTRAGDRHGTPAEAITGWKQRRICAMAADFVCRNGHAGAPCRFDVVTVTIAGSGRPRVEVIAGAFEAPG